MLEMLWPLPPECSESSHPNCSSQFPTLEAGLYLLPCLDQVELVGRSLRKCYSTLTGQRKRFHAFSVTGVALVTEKLHLH